VLIFSDLILDSRVDSVLINRVETARFSGSWSDIASEINWVSADRLVTGMEHGMT
jgi:hypothetical protein